MPLPLISESGNPNELMIKYKLTSEAIIEEVKKY